MKPQSQSHFRHHLTVEQVDNPASIARIVLRVGHHHNGSAFLIQIGQEAHYFLSVLRIQVTGRLVGKYHLRIGNYRTGYRHTLLLPSRKLLREMFRAVGYCHPFHGFLHFPFTFDSRNTHVKQRQFDVLVHIGSSMFSYTFSSSIRLKL